MNQKILCFFCEDAHLRANIEQEELVLNRNWIVKGKELIEELESGYYKNQHVFYLTDQQSIDALKPSQTNASVICLLDQLDAQTAELMQRLEVQSFALKKKFSLKRLAELERQQKFINEVDERQKDFTVLIVDDVPSNLIMLEHQLNDSYNIIKAQDGYTCIDKVLNNHVDLIILDIQLPDIDGYKVAEMLKKNVLTTHIPIIFLTAFNKETIQVEKGIKELGAIDYLYKPIDKAIINAKVSGFLSIKNYQSSLHENYSVLQQQSALLDEKNKALQDNINYASGIQKLILPTLDVFEQIFNSYYLIYKPKDILSGDFYDLIDLGDKKVIVVADCTGHGVSGALLTMTAQTMIRNITAENAAFSSAEILQRLHQTLSEFFNSDETFLNDGVELCIVCYDQQNNKLDVCGANSWLTIFDRKTGDFKKLMHNKVTVGQSIYSDYSFTSETIEVKEHWLYMLSTDGIVDHMNQRGEKFMRKQLLSCFNAGLSAKETGQQIHQKLQDWNTAQIDDKTLLVFELLNQ